MPIGYECRSKLLKQVPLKPTERRPTKWDDFVLPGPNHYETKPLFCAEGFSHIKRAPKYSFGIKSCLPVKSITQKAQLYDVRGMNKKGREHIPQGIIAEQYQPPKSKMVVPGPGAYTPKDLAQAKNPPAYSMRIAAKPPYQPWDMWTPSPNMKAPSYSFNDRGLKTLKNGLPGPGQYSPYTTEITTPAFSFTGRGEERRLAKSPAPNAYCEKSFYATKKRAPAPSFGIKHSPYLDKEPCYLQPTDLEALKKKSY